MTTLDNSVAILHGSRDNSLRWMWLSKANGTVCVGRLDRSGFFIRDFDGAPGVREIAQQMSRLWTYQLADVDLSGHATHHLAPPSMQSIEPLPAPCEPVYDTHPMF